MLFIIQDSQAMNGPSKIDTDYNNLPHAMLEYALCFGCDSEIIATNPDGQIDARLTFNFVDE